MSIAVRLSPLALIALALSNAPVLQAQLQNEIADIEEGIEDYELWPVVQLGLSYRY